MKRTGISRGSKPLQRKTPMSDGGSPLQRTKPLQARRADTAPRTAPARTTQRAAARTPRPRPTRRHTGPSIDTRALVDARDGGRCVRCGEPARDRDHRRGRGAGGTKGETSDTINGAAWLLTLCGAGNTDPASCHGWKEQNRAAAEREGYRIPRNGAFVDAELVPVLTKSGWARFLNDGTRIRVAAPLNDDAREAWRDAA